MCSVSIVVWPTIPNPGGLFPGICDFCGKMAKCHTNDTFIAHMPPKGQREGKFGAVGFVELIEMSWEIRTLHN